MYIIPAAVLGSLIVFFAFFQLLVVNPLTDDKIENIDITISYLVKKVNSLNQRIKQFETTKEQFETTKEAAEEDMNSGRNV